MENQSIHHKKKHFCPNPYYDIKLLAGILAKVVQQRFFKTSLFWLQRAIKHHENDLLKGILVIDKVISKEGTHHFRLRNKSKVIKTIDYESFIKMPYHQARNTFTKLNFQTCYGKFYGRKPDLTDLGDTDILKSQVFSQIPCARIIKESIQKYLDSWLKIEKEDSYVSKVIGTIRSLHTYIKK